MDICFFPKNNYRIIRSLYTKKPKLIKTIELVKIIWLFFTYLNIYSSYIFKYMKNIAIIYPNQLFEIQYLPYDADMIDYYIIIEDCLFFCDKERELHFNMLKLIYQRASMKYYESYLKSQKQKVIYVEFNENSNNLFKFIKNKFGTNNKLHVIDPVDRLLEERINFFSKKYHQNIVWYESPAFLLDNQNLEDYMNTIKKRSSSKSAKPKTPKKFYQYNFYIWHRKKFNILMDKNKKPIGGKYTYDKYNRKTLPGKSLKNFLRSNKINIVNTDYKNKFYTNAIKYCEKTFTNYYPENYRPENIYYYPITHTDVKKNFKNFIDKKLKFFGDFQDAIDFNEPFMFHSVISPQLNNGLITPKWIENKLMNYYEKTKSNKINFIKNIEGYIRQLNWREYSRLLYKYAYKNMTNKNYFNHKRQITKKWYTGKTGIEPIDLSIKMAFQFGYLHHIIRLMIMCNFMNLCSLDPFNVYCWFMEFSLDSYDWVMINNVYSMGLYADGGLTTTKPYISSSNYILKMSNLKKNDTWNKIWDTLYYYFIHRNFGKLHGRAIIYKSQWTKQKHKSSIIKLAKKIINKLTTS